MRLLFELLHPKFPTDSRRLLERRAARGIVQRDSRILLLYTARYDDYSLPGGGVAPDEAIEVALQRELEEETGARDVRVIGDFGRVLEARPHWGDYDAMRMESFVFHCSVGETLGAPRMEFYETANGMRPVWIELDHAIAHNRGVLERGDPGMGLSIERETRLLQLIAEEEGLRLAQAA